MYKICNTCIMDTTDKDISFDDNGQCFYCKEARRLINNYGYRGKESDDHLKQTLDKIKKEQKKAKYDCVIGISGGVDSAYLMHMAVKYWGLRVLAIHVDAGWNSEISVDNIKKLCEKLKIDLQTVVVDWNVMKEVQRAYMFSGVSNLDVPQDHVFFAALYQFAKKHHIKYILTGHNYATESILPKYLVYDSSDWISLKDICKTYGREINLKKYPHMTYFQKWRYVKTLKFIRPLNDIEYSKTKAIDELSKEYGWKYYGAKHWESRFTKFFQAYYLPIKFGFDKSRAHLSNLVVNNEMSREEALKELENEKNIYNQSEI